MTEIFYRDIYGQRLQVQCPFGERDLTTDVCYAGNKQNRCKFFICYEHYLTDSILPNGQKVVNCASSIKCSNQHKDTQMSLF